MIGCGFEMKMRTNYIRWNREMERKCLGRALQGYNQNNVSVKKIQDVSDKVEESESMTEDLQENTSEDTNDTSLQTLMKSIVKEDDIHKSYTNKSANKIHWNENMLKRCLGSYFSHAPNKKRLSRWMKKARNMCDGSNVSKDTEPVNNEIAHETVSQEDILDSQIYHGGINSEDNYENELCDSSGIEINDSESTGIEINDSESTDIEISDSESTDIDINDSESTRKEINDSERYENEKLNEDIIGQSVNETNRQGNMENFKKISWSTISDIDDEGYIKDMDFKVENIYSNDENSYKESYDAVDCDKNNNEDNNGKAENCEDAYENDCKDGYQNEQDDFENNNQDEHKNDNQDDYENDYEDSYDYEDYYKNDYKDSYVQEDLFYDEYDDNNEPEQYLNEVYSNDSELNYEMNESFAYPQNQNNVFDFEEADSLDAFDLEITDRTRNSMDWGNSWDEYNLTNTETQDIEIPEYLDDYNHISYGQSVECRIII